MNLKRILWHVLFWLMQFSISLYNELYLSASFAANLSFEIFLPVAISVFLILLVKIFSVYFFLYFIIPRWIKNSTKISLYISAFAFILFSAFLIRLVMHQVVWKIIYNEPNIVLSNLQMLARFFYSLLDLLQVVGLASAIKLFKLRINALKNEKNLEREKLRSELLHLKSQVNPHFLFNTINSIYSLSRSQSPLAPDSIMRLSKILRYMLYETGEKTVELTEEIKVMDDFIELQQLRFSKRLEVLFHKEIEGGPAKIAPLLLLPLVENAFKHGSNEGGKINILISLKKDILTFEIDNPVSENRFIRNEEEGIGLANVKRQLELLYPGFLLQTQVKQNIFKVELKINLTTYAGSELFDSRR